MTNKVIITGSSGFIGNYLCNFYINKGFDVYGIDRTTDRNSNKDVTFYNCDLESEDITDVYKAIQPDIFIHCAGNANVGISVSNPVLDFQRNVVILYNTLQSIKAANVNPKFIFLSSAAVYGNPERLPISEDSCIRPVSPYGLHKKMCEDLCEYFRYKEGLQISVVRIFSAYGEGLKKQILWDIYNKIRREGKVLLFGTGEETRDFIHIEDIAIALNLIIQNRDDMFYYNIACEKEIQIRKLAEMFAITYGIDAQLVSFNGVKKDGDPLNWRADISKLKTLGFKPTIDLETGIKRYIEWLREINNEKDEYNVSRCRE